MMFTIKYRFYTLAKAQSSEGPFYDECEGIHGPFDTVSQERDDNGYIVVHAYRDGYPMMFGPCRPSEDSTLGDREPRPIVWVMNEQGATIAKYDL